MRYLLREIPVYERPRERFEKYGAEALSDSELLAILLRTGTKNNSVINLANEILKEFDNINSLNDVTIEELCKIKGIQKAKAISILAAIELGRRITENFRKESIKIESPSDAYRFVRTKLENLLHEELVCIFLNTKSEVMKVKKISIGTTNSTLFDSKIVLKWALKFSSSYIIIAHNHPSGDPTPSDNDRIVTDQIIRAGKAVDIKVVDHIIVGKDKYYSFSENNNNYKKNLI